jgi:predicted cation transporter
MTLAVVLILIVVLFAPLLFAAVEHNLEIFFFVCGLAAALASGRFTLELIEHAAREPVPITLAAAVFGAAVRLARPLLDAYFTRLSASRHLGAVCCGLIVALGFLSSAITAVIAALVLAEALALLRLERASAVRAAVLGCFAIGMGAALTPIGEPLSTIAIGALGADFWYLARLVGPYVAVGIAAVGALSLIFPTTAGGAAGAAAPNEQWSAIALRAARLYLFVAGLVGLSAAAQPLVDAYLVSLPDAALFWLNSVAALVDNATLAAAEIGPALTAAQQRNLLMGLLLAGGMLIPGNLPNIIAAARLGISGREWARVGLAVGLPLMAACFGALYLLAP